MSLIEFHPVCSCQADSFVEDELRQLSETIQKQDTEQVKLREENCSLLCVIKLMSNDKHMQNCSSAKDDCKDKDNGQRQ